MSSSARGLGGVESRPLTPSDSIVSTSMSSVTTVSEEYVLDSTTTDDHTTSSDDDEPVTGMFEC